MIKRSGVGDKIHFINKFDSLERMCSLQMMTCHQIILFIKKVVPLRAQLSLVTSIEHGAYYDDCQVTMCSKNYTIRVRSCCFVKLWIKSTLTTKYVRVILIFFLEFICFQTRVTAAKCFSHDTIVTQH